MSIWTSDLRKFCRGAALALVLPLAGCAGEGTGFSSPSETAKSAPNFKPLRQVALYGGEVVVAGPPGYCIDGSSLRKRLNGTVIVIASCEALSGQTGTAVDPAVMTVSVAPRRSGVSQPTAAALAGSMAPARALTLDDEKGIALVRLGAGGDSLMPDGDPRYWRAAMLANGHVVSLAVYTPKDAGLSGKAGRALILSLAETLRARSPIKGTT